MDLPFRRRRVDSTAPSAPGPLVAQVAQDAAVAALVGGNLYGRLAMHPALRGVSDKQERGAVLNSAWRRYGNVNTSALLVLVGSWLATRGQDATGILTTPRRRRLARAKDVAVGAVVATGLASALAGVGFAQQAPGGAVPMESGSDPAPETPRRAAQIKRVVNVLGALNLVSELSVLAVDTLLDRAPRAA